MSSTAMINSSNNNNNVKKKESWFPLPFRSCLIILTELCERFCFYGLVSILPLFMTTVLLMSQSASVQVMSSISFSSYLFAFMGAIVADTFLGRYYTIALFAGVYSLGTFLLASSAMPAFGKAWMTGLALVIIAVGTGGIKPCVSAFGGDQIQSAEKRARFFTYFYMAINVGSLASMFLVPVIKSQPCLGKDECYSGAFLLPACLMLAGVIVFACGKRLYTPGPGKNRDMLTFFAVMGSAAKNCFKAKINRKMDALAREAPDSWLFYASDKYPMKTLIDCRAVLKVFTTFLPMCLYWGLYTQMNSRWVFQAAMMAPTIWKVPVMPEQMGIANCILVLVMIPLFDSCLYPLLARIVRKKVTAYQKILVSMVLGSISFVVAGFLQIMMDFKGTFEADPLNPENLKCVAGCYSIGWQIPQYVILTASEVFLSTANLALAYAMAPAELKSLCSAMSMLTNAAGNLVVMLMARVNPIGWFITGHGATANFFMWSGLCFLGLIWFVIATRNTIFPEDRDTVIMVEVIIDQAPKDKECEVKSVVGSQTELVPKEKQHLEWS